MNGVASQKSGAARDIPYQLRPNKFIDRQMFVEALARVIHVVGPERYIYVSMGGRHLVDHYAVYNELGIKAQFAFDEDENIVKRQRFNRPTDTTVCELMSAADLPSALDAIAGRFRSKRNFIVWLDYTRTDWKAQLQEAEQILIRLRHGDVFRITMNADVRNLGKPGPGTEEERALKRAEVLRERIGDLMPTDVVAVNVDSFPAVLARCVGLMAQRAQSHVSSNFVPILSTSYADGQRMVTVTCAVSDPCVIGAERFPCTTFWRWAFASKRWDEIHEISVPVLSAKERFKLDLNLKKSSRKMLAALKFLPAEDESTSIAVVESYKRFQRFYPVFRHVDD